jgi:hypothetical protein
MKILTFFQTTKSLMLFAIPSQSDIVATFREKSEKVSSRINVLSVCFLED